MRYFIEFAYKGTKYHGWQMQPNAISVQEVLSNGLQTVLQEKINLTAAGRTDTGVHAKQMYAHFDTDLKFETEPIIYKLNSLLPKDIAVITIIAVSIDAHARFDAKSRTYEYHINCKKNAFESDNSWYFQHKLNTDLMNSACEILKKHTDFECFSKVHTDVATFNCEIKSAAWEFKNDSYLFTITADRFLRNMVRAIVGTMINIGLEKVSLSDFETIINSKDRKKAGFSVPAHGLYLTKVAYDFIEQNEVKKYF